MLHTVRCQIIPCVSPPSPLLLSRVTNHGMTTTSYYVQWHSTTQDNIISTSRIPQASCDILYYMMPLQLNITTHPLHSTTHHIILYQTICYTAALHHKPRHYAKVNRYRTSNHGAISHNTITTITKTTSTTATTTHAIHNIYQPIITLPPHHITLPTPHYILRRYHHYYHPYHPPPRHHNAKYDTIPPSHIIRRLHHIMSPITISLKKNKTKDEITFLRWDIS